MNLSLSVRLRLYFVFLWIFHKENMIFYFLVGIILLAAKTEENYDLLMKYPIKYKFMS